MSQVIIDSPRIVSDPRAVAWCWRTIERRIIARGDGCDERGFWGIDDPATRCDTFSFTPFQGWGFAAGRDSDEVSAHFLGDTSLDRPSIFTLFTPAERRRLLTTWLRGHITQDWSTSLELARLLADEAPCVRALVMPLLATPSWSAQTSFGLVATALGRLTPSRIPKWFAALARFPGDIEGPVIAATRTRRRVVHTALAETVLAALRADQIDHGKGAFACLDDLCGFWARNGIRPPVWPELTWELHRRR